MLAHFLLSRSLLACYRYHLVRLVSAVWEILFALHFFLRHACLKIIQRASDKGNTYTESHRWRCAALSIWSASMWNVPALHMWIVKTSRATLELRPPLESDPNELRKPEKNSKHIQTQAGLLLPLGFGCLSPFVRGKSRNVVLCARTRPDGYNKTIVVVLFGSLWLSGANMTIRMVFSA